MATTGVLRIDRRQHNGEPSEYLVSFGGTKDGVGAYYLAKASDLEPLTALLRKVGVSGPAIRTVLQALVAEPHHQIPNVTITREHFYDLGLF